MRLPASRRGKAVAALLMLALQQSMLVLQLLEQQRLLLQSQLLLLGAIGALAATSRGMRQFFGTNKVRTAGYLNTVLVMMDANPQQFYEDFRMLPKTYVEFEKILWETMHPSAPSIAELLDPTTGLATAKRRRRGTRGRHADPMVFRKRLLITIDFLATGESYRELSRTWGQHVHWSLMLVEEIAALKDRFIIWPTFGREMADVQAEFSRLRDGVDACCGDIDGVCVQRTPSRA